MKRWLSNDLLRWIPWQQSWRSFDAALRHRAYEHLDRAEQFVVGREPVTSADRADCVANLRRSLTHRLQVIESLYRLREALESGRKKPYLRLLAELSLVRPFLLERLLKVRNAIEYKDSVPPTSARCRELIDVLWYFLRSTDPLVTTQTTEIMISPQGPDVEGPYWCELHMTYAPRFVVEIRGWIPYELILTTRKLGAIQVTGEIRTRSERWKKEHSDKRELDVYINGRAKLESRDRIALMSIALNCPR